jgi:hypothetical protein
MISNRISNHIGYLIYTTEEGGEYKIIDGFRYEKYLELLENKYFELKTNTFDSKKIFPAYAAYVVSIAEFDFALKS